MNDMNSILKNFNSAGSDQSKEGTPSEQGAMQSLLEGLDSAQQSVNQMPGTHTMAKSTDTAHPAEKFLVGGEHDKETNLAEVTPDEVAAIWKEVFPHSSLQINKLQNGAAFKFRLAAGPSEVSGGIMDNDPLNYMVMLRGKEWKENLTSLTVAPEEGSHMAFGSVKLRKKTAKNITTDLIRNRFNQIKDFITANASKLHQIDFDINEKLGTTVTESDTYEDTIAKRNPVNNVHKKQDLATRFKKELHDELDETAKDPELRTTGSMSGMLDDIKRLIRQGKTVQVTARGLPTDRYRLGAIVSYSLSHEETK